MRTVAFAVFTTVALLGCVMYPTQRTYFEPNAQDGVPTPSRSCGYNNARNDALFREVGGLHVQVAPELTEGKPLTVSVLFRSTLSAADVSPEKYELRSVTNGATFLSSSSKVTTHLASRTHPYYSRWLTLQFQVVPEDLNEIEVVFPAGTVSLNGEVIKLAPFRFHKTTKGDIYYSSINC